MNHSFVMLIRREFWEHRGTFVILPLALAAFAVGMLLFATLVFNVIGVEATVDLDMSEGDADQTSEYYYESDQVSLSQLTAQGVQALSEMSEKRRYERLRAMFLGIGMPFQVVLSLVVVFYLIGTLYNDRKDRSVLFWKSMPVSDTNTVLAKLVTGTLVVPLLYAFCIIVLHVIMLVFGTLNVVGEGIPVVAMLWQPLPLLSNWLELIVVTLVQFCWGLPLYGWLLLVGAAVKSVPVIWAIAIPVGFSVAEGIVRQEHTSLAVWFWSHCRGLFTLQLDAASFGSLHVLTSFSSLAGLVVGSVFISGAIWLRGRADEI